MQKKSPYVEWSKTADGFEHNLAMSGVGACPRELLAGEPVDFAPSSPDPHGWPPLLEKLAERQAVTVDQITLAHGTSMANHLVMASLIEKGDDVLVERPCFDPFHLVPQLYGARVRFVRRQSHNQFDIDPADVEASHTDQTRLLVLSDLHNPTGKRLGQGTLTSLVELAERKDFLILIDEIYLEFLRPEVNTSACLSPRIVTTSSLTKAYGLDGLRAGWITASKELTTRFRAMQDLFSITTAHPTERLALRALERSEKILEPVRERLRRNWTKVEIFLQSNPSLSWQRPDGGSVCWVNWGRDCTVLVEHLKNRYQTVVAPGQFFGCPRHFRLGFGMPSETLMEALTRLQSAIDDLTGTADGPAIVENPNGSERPNARIPFPVK